MSQFSDDSYEALTRSIARLKRSNWIMECEVKKILLDPELRTICTNHNLGIDFEGISDALIECAVARKQVSEAEKIVIGVFE